MWPDSTLRLYLHDIGSSFIPVPYSVSLCIYMIPTKISFKNKSFHNEPHPDSRIGSKFTFWYAMDFESPWFAPPLFPGRDLQRWFRPPLGPNPQESRPPLGLNPQESRPPLGLNPQESRPPLGLNPQESRPPLGLNPQESRPPLGLNPQESCPPPPPPFIIIIKIK